MTASPLKTAICAFKAEHISIKKESANPFFKSKYADLPTILEAIEVKAAKHGLVITSESKLQGELWVLETTLECKDSDEQKKSTFPIFGGKPQEIGSSITYARRYNIQSLLNLAADDDDGNEANQAEPVKKTYTTAAAKNYDGKAILAAFDKCKSSEELDEAWADNLGAINYFKTAKGADADFYTQIVERGKSLRASFAMMEANNG
jgi:hypothetical protein